MAIKDSLINDLTNEHVLMLTALDKINGLGVSSSEAQAELKMTKTMLLKHIEKEDKHLYPVLRNKAKNDAFLSRTLEVFAKDMDSISSYCLEFFDKYSSGGSGIEFAKDFGRLYTILKSRVSKEEKVIFPNYE